MMIDENTFHVPPCPTSAIAPTSISPCLPTSSHNFHTFVKPNNFLPKLVVFNLPRYVE
jgi:hypothetical protein